MRVEPTKAPRERSKISHLVSIPAITLTVGVVLAGSVLVAAIAFIFLPNYREPVTFIAVATTAAGQLAAALYAVRALTATVENNALLLRHQRMEVAFRYCDRWSDGSWSPRRPIMFDIIDATKTGEQIKHDLQNAKAEATLENVLNLLEQLSIAVQREHCDERVAKEYFRGIVMNTWRRAQPWVILEETARGRHRLWENARTLYDRWKSGEG